MAGLTDDNGPALIKKIKLMLRTSSSQVEITIKVHELT